MWCTKSDQEEATAWHTKEFAQDWAMIMRNRGDSGIVIFEGEETHNPDGTRRS